MANEQKANKKKPTKSNAICKKLGVEEREGV